jgi:hypothetical protein
MNRFLTYLYDREEEKILRKVRGARSVFYPFVIHPIEYIHEKLLQEPYLAYQYCKVSPWWFKHLFKARWRQVRFVASKDANAAYWFSKKILKGRWAEAEDVIRQDPRTWFDYVSEISSRGVSEKTKWKWLKKEITPGLVDILNWTRMNRAMKEYICIRRPDLIGQIEKLDPELKGKFEFEVELGTIDL